MSVHPSQAHLHPAVTGQSTRTSACRLPDEHTSDCARCPMAGAPFHPEVRCCTYEPALPNFLVGRALERGGIGASRLRARIAKGTGVTPLGLRPDPSWTAEYVDKRETDFGRNPDWACPYWVEGPLSCSIWPDRNAVCRSWHCRHDAGVHGHRVWSAWRKLAQAAERAVSTWCAENVPADPDWEAYFIETHRIAGAAPATADLMRLERDLEDALEHLDRPIPDVLGVEVREVRPEDEHVVLVGYTPWNPRRYPRDVFALLAAFDGRRTREQAIAHAQSTHPDVRPEWVESLWAIGVLRAHEDPSIPWGFEGPDLDPDTLRARHG